MAAAAGELTLDVTTSGAIDRIGPVVDRLTSRPLLPGQQVIAVEAGTPAEPQGQVRDRLGPVQAGSVLVVEAVTAQTERVENGELSAETSVGGGRVDVLGISVLDVGEVSSRVTTHPDEPPTATTSTSGLEVFGAPVTLPEGKDVDLSLDLSTDQVVELLDGVVPGISSVTGFVARVASAGGTIDVTVRSESTADEAIGAARATGLVAQVEVGLDVRLCVPELSGDGCVGEVAVTADGRVLDLQLAQSAVERPAAVAQSGAGPGEEAGSVNWWVAAPLMVLVAALLVIVGAVVGSRLARHRRISFDPG